MLCSNCGKNMRDSAKFCPHCGAVNGSASAGGSTPEQDTSYSYSQPTPPSGGGKKRRGTGLIIGGVVVAAVAVVAALVVGVHSLFGASQEDGPIATKFLDFSDKGQVEKAINKSVVAYRNAKKTLNLPNMKELTRSRSMSQRFSLELNSINEQLTGGYDLSSLKGLGVRVSTDLDCKDRKMDADMTAYWGSNDIVSFQMLVDDSNLYLCSPEFFDDVFLGMNTETMGADLCDIANESDETIENIGFNIFDLVEKYAPEGQEDETEKAMKAAGKELLKAIEVKKAGSETIDVNGKSTKATAYHVVIPQDALEDFVDALEDVMKTVDYVDLYEDILLDIGLSKDMVEDLMYRMDDTDIYGQMADSLKDALDEIGDVELEVYLSGGYVSAVTYEDKIMGTKIEAGLYLGGGDQYVDNLSLVIEGNGSEITLESAGNHSGKGGAFTDETTIRVRSHGETLGRITSEMSYTVSSGDLQWEIGVDSNGTAVGSLEMDGTLTTSKESMELVLDDISVKAMGIKVVSLSAEYSVGPCKGMTVTASSPEMLADMSQSDLIDFAYDIQDNYEDWMTDMQKLVQNKLPEELLWYLMYRIF